MKFKEVVGQEEARQRLLQLVAEHRVPHAMMLCGPAGCGKMALALAFASFLLGEYDETDPLQTEAIKSLPQMQPERRRNAVAMLHKWSHPDLLFSYPVIRPKNTGTEHKMQSDDFAQEWNDMLLGGVYFSLDHWLSAMGAENQQARIGVGRANFSYES